MPKTKEQKVKDIEESSKDLRSSKTLVFVDFTGTPVNKLNEFRKVVRETGGIFRVIRKRLLKFIFGNEDVDFEPQRFEGQIGVVFSPKETYETSSSVYKFSSVIESLKILGGFDVESKRFIESGEVIELGKLPSKEVILSQLVGMLSAPIRMLLYVLDQKSKEQMVEK